MESAAPTLSSIVSNLLSTMPVDEPRFVTNGTSRSLRRSLNFVS